MVFKQEQQQIFSKAQFMYVFQNSLDIPMYVISEQYWKNKKYLTKMGAPTPARRWDQKFFRSPKSHVWTPGSFS